MGINDILQLIKLPMKYLIAIFLTLTFILFFPEIYIVKLGLSELIQKYRMIIGLAFICDLFFIIVNLCSPILNYIKGILRYLSLVLSGKRRLNNLTNEEKEILNYYITNKTRTYELPLNDGIVCELSSYKIIYRAAGVSTGGLYFAYNMNPWAWRYLNKNKELINIDDKTK